MEDNVKIYYQIVNPDVEGRFSEFVSSLKPGNMTFSSFEFKLCDNCLSFEEILNKISSIIDVGRDSVIVLYNLNGEDLISDLGVKMAVEYS
jgi:hypothetical protein